MVVQEPGEASLTNPEHGCQPGVVIEDRRPLRVLGGLREGEAYGAQSAQATLRSRGAHHHEKGTGARVAVVFST